MEESEISPVKSGQTLQPAGDGGGDSHIHTLFTPAPKMSASSSRPALQPDPVSQFKPIMIPVDLHSTSGTRPDVRPTASTSRPTGSSLEGKMVEQTLETVLFLPQVLSEVRTKQKDQSSEIQRQKYLLKQLQKELETEKMKINEMSDEKASVKRKVFLTEEDIITKKCSCGRLQKEIDDLVVEKEMIVSEILELDSKCEQDLKTYTQYKSKMEEFYKTISETEPYTLEKKQIEEEIEKLRLQKISIGSENNIEEIQSGCLERRLAEELRTIREEQELRKVDIMECENKIQSEKEKQRKIKQEMEVLKKRNNAQMTRLKAQLREAHTRQRFFSEQALLLENTLAQLQNI